jgi:hypothetical protein
MKLFASARLAARFSYLILLILFIPFLTSCDPSIPSPSALEGKWIEHIDKNLDQLLIFSSSSVEYALIDTGHTTSTWTDKYTKVFTSANGVNIIETEGPPTFAWYVTGNSLHLDWVNSDAEAQLESLPSNWWQSTGWVIWTKY